MTAIRVLLDTNIFISREDNRVIPEPLQKLLKTMNTLNVQVLLHPLSIEDIKRDTDTERRQVSLSKLDAYAHLDSPPNCSSDGDFLSVVGPPQKPNDLVDNELIYAVYKNAVHLLITEDAGIKRKASRLGIAERALGIRHAQAVFTEMLPNDGIGEPPLIHKCPLHNLNINDIFFDDLKLDYDDFESWFKRISREGRDCYTYFKDNDKIGALLIFKDEEESIDSVPPLPLSRRLKLCTLKVEETGFRLGELFIKLAVQYARNNDIPEIYLTHVSKKPSDELETLIANYGFEVAGTKGREEVWLKKLAISRHDLSTVPPTDISIIWPSFYDAPDVQKIVVPIQPVWHDRLFINFPYREPSLFEFFDFIIEGNAIEKAYLGHPPLKNISPGSILLFYRSHDMGSLTALGVVKEAHFGLQDPREIIDIVRKRTVYREEEIDEIAKKPTTVILFTWNCYLDTPISLDELKKEKILKGAPQSMQTIPHQSYLKILKKGGVDERFTIH